MAPITAPYTFLPFAPPITARQLWSHDCVVDDPTTAFDRPLPGLLTGTIDLTITGCSALYIGDATASGRSFCWPAEPTRFAIPGASIRGMLRSQIEALTGSALGLADRDDVIPRIRYPIGVTQNNATTPRTRNLRTANLAYTNRRGPSTARPGAQRVGLLQATTTSWTVTECPQFMIRLPGKRPFRKMASARWPVVTHDLLTTHPGDRRTVLAARRGRLVHVVWAAISVDTVERPAVVGIGDTAAAALTNAADRVAGRNGRHISQAAPTTTRTGNPTTVTFVRYLDSGWFKTATPHTREMALLPTNLANLTDAGLPIATAQTPAGNCYLVAHPRDDLNRGHTPEAAPLPVHPDARTELLEILRQKPSEWTPTPPTGEQLRGWPTAANGASSTWPVFFDTDGVQVTHLGPSNGFAILAHTSVKQAVTNHPHGRWERTLHGDAADNDVADALFGAIDTDHQLRGRVDVGHATATTALTPLTARRAALFSPHLQSAATRLHAPAGTENRVSFDDTDARYRGRQFYWHRGTWNGTGEHTWEDHVNKHERLFGDPADNTPHTHDDDDRNIAPLPVGAQFVSSIRFFNLSPSELGLLMFALRFGQPATATADTPTFAHKIGGAKPLGLGSVHLQARVSLTTLRRYTHPFDGDGINHNIDTDPHIQAFLDAARWAPKHIGTDWVSVPETQRRWPPHVAAWLFVHRWRNRPQPSRTDETGVDGFLSMIPMDDVFTIAQQTPLAPFGP